MFAPHGQVTGSQEYGAAPAPYVHYPAYGYNPPASAPYPEAVPGNGIASWLDFSNGCYLKGFLVGAAATLILTNPGVQKAMIRGAVKLWSFVQGGVEEVKEQFQDIKAEMSLEEES